MAVSVLEAPPVVQPADIIREIERFLEMAQRRCEVCVHPRRRATRRYHRSWPLVVRTSDFEQADEFAVALHNASELGIAFLSCRRIEVDDRLGIKLFWHEPEGTYVPAIVRHCTATRHGHIVGCEFIRC